MAANKTAQVPADVHAFLAPYTPAVQAIALRLRKLVLTTVSDAIEQLDPAAKLIAYGFARTYKDMICVIMPLKGAVNLGLPHGAELQDPKGIVEGTGKRARHVKLTDISQVDTPAVRALLKASVAAAKR